MASSSSIRDDTEEESIISYYFSRGYTYKVITEFLAKFHGKNTVEPPDHPKCQVEVGCYENKDPRKLRPKSKDPSQFS